MLPVFLYATTTTRPDGSSSCNIYWAYDESNNSSNATDNEQILNEQTAFTFYSLLFGFLGPLAFILIFYVLGTGLRCSELFKNVNVSHLISPNT